MPKGIPGSHPPCSVPGCERRHAAQGKCHLHYKRWKVTGTTEDPRSLPLRFWPKVNKNGPVPDYRPELGPCWIWTGTLNSKGYGVIKINYRQQPATRVAFTLVGTPIADGLHGDHLCRVPACVKVTADEHGPAHLEAVTPRENYLRGVSPFAENARKTHCLRGHPFDEVNTRILVSGSRSCRTCLRAKKRERRRRQRERSHR